MARQAIFEASVHYFLEPIRHLLEDQTVSEIMVNRFDDVYIERHGKLEHTEVQFANDDALLSAINNIAQWVGREIGEEHPVLDARLPDGSRVHAVIPPSARTGIYLTIRKFTRDALTLEDLVLFGSLSETAKEFLEICVQLRKNMLISGGTGTGKTVLLGAISRAIPEEERIVVIEDTSELRLFQRHALYLEAQHANHTGRGALSVRQLFANSLRMRPDRIIVGEVRGGESLDLIQSMISGHAGSMSTIHATTPLDALIRLETLSLMSDVEIPVYVARAQVASAIDLVIQIARFTADGSRRIVRITETLGLDDNNRYQMHDLFTSQLQEKNCNGRWGADLLPTGQRPTFCREPFAQALSDRIHHTDGLWEREPIPCPESSCGSNRRSSSC